MMRSFLEQLFVRVEKGRCCCGEEDMSLMREASLSLCKSMMLV